MKKNKTWVKVITCAVLLSIFAGCAEQGDIDLPFEEEVLEIFEGNLDAGVTFLDFETYNGYIKIHLWDKQEYKIEVNKWAEAKTAEEAKEKVKDLQVDFSVSGSYLRLKVEYQRNTSADVTAYLPDKSYDTVGLSSTNGDLKMGEITASDVSLNTTNGAITAYITADNIEVTSTNGEIEGFFQGDTVNIETTNGKIDIECGDGGQYTVNSTNGKITIKAGLCGEFDISTTDGSIDITVAGDFDFDLETTNGTTEVVASGVTYEVDKRTHKEGYTAEDADLSITASSTNASITVTKK